MTETSPPSIDEPQGTRYEQVVARRLSRADRARGRDLLTAEFWIGVALYVLIAQIGFGLFLLWKITDWIGRYP